MKLGKDSFYGYASTQLVWVLAGSPAVLALLAVLVAVLAARRWSAFRKEVDAELAEIHDSGQPVCVEDLSWFYPRPAPDQDMTKPILDALALLPKDIDKSKLEDMVRDWDEFGPPDKWPDRPKGHAQPADVERCLREGRRGIDSLEQAATKDGSARYPIDLDPDQHGRRENHVLPLLTAGCHSAIECERFRRTGRRTPNREGNSRDLRLGTVVGAGAAANRTSR